MKLVQRLAEWRWRFPPRGVSPPPSSKATQQDTQKMTTLKTTNCESKENVMATFDPSPKENIARAFIENLNARVSLVSLFHPRAEVVFPEAKMPIGEYQEEMTSCVKAFPDFRLDYATPLQEQADGTVVVNVYGHGHHTSAPYGFGPYPAIEAKGVYCRNDPERVTFFISDEKISRVTFVPVGELSGPPGFYTQIGGVIF